MRRGGRPDLLEERADADGGLLRVGLPVHADRLGDLVADLLDRVQRVQRALEDDRRTGPSDRSETPGLQRQDVLAVEHELALDLRLGGVQPQDRAGDRRLAAPGFAGQPDHLALARSRTVTPRTAGTSPPFVRVGDAQVVDARTAHRSLSFGLRISSMANPIIVNAEDDEHDRRRRAASIHHQYPARRRPASNASSMIVAPRDVTVGSPSPEERQRGLRQDRDRDVRTVFAKIDGHHVRQDVPRDRRAQSLAPSARDRSTYGRSLTDSTCARTSRAVPAHEVMPMIDDDDPDVLAEDRGQDDRERRATGCTRNQSVKPHQTVVSTAP